MGTAFPYLSISAWWCFSHYPTLPSSDRRSPHLHWPISRDSELHLAVQRGVCCVRFVESFRDVMQRLQHIWKCGSDSAVRPLAGSFPRWSSFLILRQQKTMFLCARWNWPGLRGGKLRAQICAENLGTRGMLVSVWHGRGIPAPACRAESLLGGSSFRFQL